MRKMIRADLRRVCRKPSMWILMAIMIIVQFFDVLTITDESMEQVLTSARNRFGLTFMLVISIFIVISVLANDRNSNSWAYDIGIGIGRRKLIWAKVIVFVILMVIFYAVLVPERLFFYAVTSLPLSGRQLSLLAVYAGLQVIRGVSVLIIDMLVDILTDSTALAILANVAQVVFITLGTRMAALFYNVNIGDYTPDGLVENAYNNIAAGRFPWQLIVVLLIYVGAVFAVAAAVFRNKELQL